MGLFRDLINEARNTSVPTEYRIALGQLKRMYNAGDVPSEKELQKDSDMIAKKNHLEEDKFFEFVKSQFKINEAKITKSDSGEFTLKDGIIQITKKELNKIHKDYKSDKTLLTMINGRTVSVPFTIINESLKVGDTVELDVYSIENSEYVNQFPGKNVPKSVKIISPKINVNGDFTFEVPKYKGKEAILPKKFILESAVGTPGRTTKEDAEAHITPELRAEFEKIIKQIGGKAVARALLDGNPDNGEITEKVVGYCVTGFKDEEDFKRVQKKFFKDGLSWGRDSSKDEKGKEALKQAGVRSFDDLALYTEGKDMYVTDKGNTQRRKDLNKIDADEIK